MGRDGYGMFVEPSAQSGRDTIIDRLTTRETREIMANPAQSIEQPQDQKPVDPKGKGPEKPRAPAQAGAAAKYRYVEHCIAMVNNERVLAKPGEAVRGLSPQDLETFLSTGVVERIGPPAPKAEVDFDE